MKLKPFFTFYGGKWRSAPRYPSPTYGSIVEPFAGSAGYSVRHHERAVTLIEKDTCIAALWRYLICSTGEDIARLPLIEAGQSVDDLDVPYPAKTLIGFWLNKGAAAPCKKPSAWMREGKWANSFWGEAVRDRVARQVEFISHWRVVEGDYFLASDEKATWFIDPPYKKAGKYYKHGSAGLDYGILSTWCRSRKGQIVVCENEGENWLPFEMFLSTKANESRHGGRRSAEAIWCSG